MDAYVLGSLKFAKIVKKSCKKVKVLEDLQDVWRLPHGAVLYTDLPLRTAAMIKLKAPWLSVRVGATEVVGVKFYELSVYELLNDIRELGTCDVYVPDDVVRQALKSFSSYPITFVETCQPTVRCSGLFRKTLDMMYELYSRWPVYNYYSGLDNVVINRRYLIPVSLPAPSIPIVLETETTCTTIGTPYFGLFDWDYFLSYPLGLSAEELAAQLREGKLKFQKIIPELKTRSLCR